MSRAGVILAAGLGSRMQNEEGDHIKPLTPVGGVPLLFRAVRSLELAGCQRIIVVVGYRSEALSGAIAKHKGGVPIASVVNERYDLKNGVSLLVAGQHVGDDFVVTMADHLLGNDMMMLARGHRPPSGGATLMVDKRVDDIFDIDDATKVLTDHGCLVDIGKQLADYNAIDTGVFICTRGLLNALQAVLDEQGDVSLSEGVARLAKSGRMTTLDVGNAFWQDVDTPQMLAHAERVLASRRTVKIR